MRGDFFIVFFGVQKAFLPCDVAGKDETGVFVGKRWCVFGMDGVVRDAARNLTRIGGERRRRDQRGNRAKIEV